MASIESILGEVQFQSALSGGPGGQHVNKTESKVILTWDVSESSCINSQEKQRILNQLANRINSDSILKLSVTKSRSQHQNKKIVKESFIKLIQKALQKPKKRIKTKPSRSSKLKRLQKKKQQSDKKQLRKKPKL
ncbi:alternative ribosome rescue aminoacyl-tRNA hydrolase ArfB [Psychroflexus tropicus]|uniref:alternative ribosome rescue aminoacyl-tRNA hydrolase ArfB n=1 Tax=Psychroflexus tropicus TaxID=197345 RepID=UPI00035DADAB|nr:alternative ribosome rescue aminoacyl-tRNA hydrolase ArfB [Psychroflexus tropicus]